MSTYPPARRPLTNRSVQGPSNPSPSKQTRTVSGSKRPLSPDHGDSHSNPTVKRVRASPQETPTPQENRGPEKEKGKKVSDKVERQQKANEFKDKYSRAFPTWTFYFDSENLGTNAAHLKTMVLHLGAKIDAFFSSSVTHLITNYAIPNPDKENSQVTTKAKNNLNALKSPIKLLGRGGENVTSCSVVNKALEYNMKIWPTVKLESVLSRTLDSPIPQKATTSNRHLGADPLPQQRSLSHLLRTEKIHGTTERDPTQKRHDYRYFTRGSCFVLLEDIRQELATIAAHEYPVFKERDKLSKKPWPVLHCHPLARNPFTPFDDREKKRWERLQQAEKTQEDERNAKKKREIEAMKRKAEAYTQSKGKGDLRRTVSVSNLHRRHSVPVGGIHDPVIDLDDYDDHKSTNASGYIAASGNSVGITSTTGTTSTSGRVGRNIPYSSAITQRLQQHVVTSRKFPTKDKVEKVEPAGAMGPPSKLPTKQPILKKSKSTNTLKLPKREEGVKPGYCESCRAKFSDFSTHTESRKHRKFAANPDNFATLDDVIDRLRRRTVREVEQEKLRNDLELFEHCKLNAHKPRVLSSP